MEHFRPAVHHPFCHRSLIQVGQPSSSPLGGSGGLFLNTDSLTVSPRLTGWLFYAGKVILCIDYVVFCLRLMSIFTISRTLGPKIIIVRKMVSGVRVCVRWKTPGNVFLMLSCLCFPSPTDDGFVLLHVFAKYLGGCVWCGKAGHPHP